MREKPQHPPKPGVRRFVHDGWLDTAQKRREFAAAVHAIETCGLAAEVAVEPRGADDAWFKLYATRRVRTGSTER